MTSSPRAKVLLGVPTGGTPLAPFVRALLDLQRFELCEPDPRYELLPIDFAQSIYVASNRNKLVRIAREAGADWLLQLDDDESFEPHALRQLMDTAIALPAEIVFGLYANTQPAPQGIEGGFIFADMIYRELPNGAYENIVPPLDSRPFRVDAAGSGVLLTRMSVFDRLAPPYFDTPTIQVLGEEEDGPREMNEDIYFSRIAREAGFSLWCDPRVEAKHYKRLPLLASPMRRFLARAHEVEKEMTGL